MRGRDTIRNQQGFTLIEIIAVLVLIGILAAVAVPKYMDMQDQAKASSLAGALGAASANVELSFAKYLAQNSGTAPSGITSNEWTPGLTPAVNIATTVGDFTAGYSYNNGVVTITIATGAPSWLAGYITDHAGANVKTITVQ